MGETIGLFIAIVGVFFCLYRLLVEAVAAGVVKGNHILEEEENIDEEL